MTQRVDRPMNAIFSPCRLRTFVRTTSGSLLILCLGLSNVQAARFGVRVVAPDGEPLSGVAVCVGMPGNYRQFGADFTDADGKAMMDVPNVPLVVTVSKNRFTGARLSEPARGFNLIREIILVDGVSGPHCRAGSSLVQSPRVPELQITGIDVIDEGGSVMLVPNVSGEPSHYRISTQREFYGARWENYDDLIRLAPNLSSRDTLYVQWRKRSGNEAGWIEALSPVVTLVIPSS